MQHKADRVPTRSSIPGLDGDAVPIIFFAVAGALAGGGIGGSWYFWRRGQQEAAAQLTQRDAEILAEALEREISLEQLRRRAQAEGVDPDEVERGYLALKAGQVQPDEVLAALAGFLRQLPPDPAPA